MTGAVFDLPDVGVASTPATELLVRRAVRYEEVAEVRAAVSQGSPPAVT